MSQSKVSETNGLMNEASDFAKNSPLYHSPSLPLGENRCPERAPSALSCRVVGALAASSDGLGLGVLAGGGGEQSMFKSHGRQSSVI